MTTAARPFRENMIAAGLMTGSMAAFTLNDACMKALSDELPFFQALFLRSMFTTAFLLILALRMGVFRVPIAGRDRVFVGLRTLGEIAAAYFFITALFNMPIANVTAIIQVLPLSVTLAAAVFLREPIGWRRMGAIIVGLIGVLIIIRPGPDGFNPYAVYALIAVAGVTLRDVATRSLTRSVPTIAVAFTASVGVFLFAAVGAATIDWQPVSPLAASQLAGSVGFIIAAYMFSVLVMRTGDISFVAPFRYSAILIALLVGFFVFGEFPDAVTLIGVAIVVAAGIFTFYRERQAALAPR